MLVLLRLVVILLGMVVALGEHVVGVSQMLCMSPPASCVHQVLPLFRTLQAISHLQMGGYDPALSLPTLSSPCLGKLATPVGRGTWLDLALIGIGWCNCWTG